MKPLSGGLPHRNGSSRSITSLQAHSHITTTTTCLPILCLCLGLARVRAPALSLSLSPRADQLRYKEVPYPFKGFDGDLSRDGPPGSGTPRADGSSPTRARRAAGRGHNGNLKNIHVDCETDRRCQQRTRISMSKLQV